jgi:hypothetical protein
MRLVFLLSLLVLFISCNSATTTNSQPSALTKTEVKKEEDCDDKAKKTIEIKEDTISLSGNTGCSLDEAKPAL